MHYSCDESVKYGNPAKNIARATFGWICQKWPDAGPARVRAEIQLIITDMTV